MAVWKKARRIWGMVCLLLVLAAGLALPAAADVGPKPSVEVVFQGWRGGAIMRPCWAMSLNMAPGRRRKSIWTEGGPGGLGSLCRLSGAGGLVFSGELCRLHRDRTVCVELLSSRDVLCSGLAAGGGPLPAQRPAGEPLCVRQPVHRDSHEEGLTVRSSYDYAGEVPGFLVRVALTILIETAAGWLLFGLRRRDQLALIFRVNLVTQLVLNLLLNLCAYFAGPMLAGWPISRWSLGCSRQKAPSTPGACPGR